MQNALQHSPALDAAIFPLGILAGALTAKLIRFRSIFQKQLALVAIMATTIATFWVTRPEPPALSAVNGTYRNPCCEAITLHDGVLITPQQEVPFKLRIYKFGLVVAATKHIFVDAQDKVTAVAVPDPDGYLILVDDDLRGFIVLGSSFREYHFRR